MNFKLPSAAQRLKAIGPTGQLPEPLRKALEPTDDFQPISSPKPGDWLAAHSETGQSFEQFVRSGSNRPDKTRCKIYLQPLGQFPKTKIALAETLRQYTTAYFAMPVEVLPALPLTAHDITTRINTYTRKRQILAGDVLNILKKKLPADAFCVLAITMEDLYPEPSWNFVFGQASLTERVGVYSFARYDPAFYGENRGKDYESILLRRSCKVLAHETAHIFGLKHCIYFKCVVNGSNHLKESDARPLHLCPVCLHKLQHSIGFDVAARYANLYRFYNKNGFEDDAQWSTRRLEHILGPEKAQDMIKQKDKAK